MNTSSLLLFTPLFGLAQSLSSNLFRKTSRPVRGSLVYCDLVFGYAEHSGIYIGNDKIVHKTGKGKVEIVSSRQFIDNTTAISIYVSCDSNGQAIGGEDIALVAEAEVGSISQYKLLGENCHQFCSYCLTGNFYNQTSLLLPLKREAYDYLGATHWRAWDLLNRP